MISGIYTDYLRRIGITDPGSPSAEGLFALHRAHVERVPFENTDIQLGRPPGIDPELSVRRLAAGRGGYCFHLNGAFAALLEHLGYDVTRHVGGVCEDRDARDVSGDHLTLTVRVDGRAYFVDVGLGDGPHEPLPLLEGGYEQGFRYSLKPLGSTDGPDAGWTFHHEGAPFPVMNFRSAPAAMADFADEHARLSTAPDSPFQQSFVMLRRDTGGIHRLHGRVLVHTAPDGGRDKRVLASAEEFFATMATVFGRELDDLTPADRAALWTRVEKAHEAWLASRPA
ncbi:arylamine N-acetyltransferase family protein [Streptomyces sp. NBC_01294]|uniref:arylamine N-acetyltransferase family protein n=1 Tax=Streptomyces sp. NBC_01294 TaxID=2903815 RepID=UPI002DDA46E7|nr:arylamine N-acetyltransferase [Streptomyces sp. NBC_01294]WRZ57875.1 arylamine N-acetyltransferase [Streptomyces sp. NBC_01294]